MKKSVFQLFILKIFRYILVLVVYKSNAPICLVTHSYSGFYFEYLFMGMEKNKQKQLQNLELPLYELSIDGNELYKVDQISLVNECAIMKDFLYFKNESEIKTNQLFKFKTANEEKRLIYGPAMISNLPIYRSPNIYNPDGYYVYYTTETVEKVAHKFMKEQMLTNFNIQHSKEKNNAGVQLVESWVTKDKFSQLGMEYDAGTWIVGLYVADDNTWDNYVKTGIVAGLSVEILSELIPAQFSKQDNLTGVLPKIIDLLKNEGYL